MAKRLYKRGQTSHARFYDLQGKRITRTTGCSDRKTAEAKLREFERRAADPDYAAAHQASSPMLGRLLAGAVLAWSIVAWPSVASSEEDTLLTGASDQVEQGDASSSKQGEPGRALSDLELRAAEARMEVLLGKAELRAVTAESVAKVETAAAEGQKRAVDVFLAELAMFFAVAGLIVPGLTYIFAYRPAHRASAEAKAALSRIDEVLAEQIRKYDQDQLERAIEQITTGDQDEVPKGIAFLNINTHRDLSEKQTFDLCQAARSAEVAVRNQLVSFLSGRKSTYIDDLVIEVLRNGPVEQWFLPAARRIALGSERVSAVMQEIVSVPDEARFFMMHQFVHQLAAVGKVDSALRFVQEVDAARPLSRHMLIQLLTSLRSAAPYFGSIDDIESSSLAQRFKGVVRIFLKSDHTEVVDDLSKAQYVTIYEDSVQTGMHFSHEKEFMDALALERSE